MSVEQAQRTVNQLNKDISDLDKKMFALVSKEAEKTKKIGSIERSITKNTSVSMIRSKTRQIEQLQKDLSHILSDKAGISKKLADKRKKLADATIKMQKEESTRVKNITKEQDKIYDTYEQQISDLSSQLESQQQIVKANKNLFDSSGFEEYDVFVSHATEDKESFCDEFVQILKAKYALNIWYDTTSIGWGDSIRTEIDRGLKKSKVGVVVLSRSYKEKYWTNYELEGLFQRESNGGKLILPVWHDITKKEVQEFSLSLAGKMAMNTAIMTADEIAEKLNELLKSCEEDMESER